MLEKLREFYNDSQYLGLMEISAMVAACRVNSYRRGDVLVPSGDVSYKMFLVLKGLLRCHLLKTSGEERTVFLANEGTFVGSPRTLMSGAATNETITALEDTWVAVYDTRTIDRLADEYPKIQKFYMESMKRHFYEAVGRIEFHTVMTPQERYEHMLKNHPELLQRVKQNHLASYLGITPVSLSRIRARVAGPST